MINWIRKIIRINYSTINVNNVVKITPSYFLDKERERERELRELIARYKELQPSRKIKQALKFTCSNVWMSELTETREKIEGRNFT